MSRLTAVGPQRLILAAPRRSVHPSWLATAVFASLLLLATSFHAVDAVIYYVNMTRSLANPQWNGNCLAPSNCGINDLPGCSFPSSTLTITNNLGAGDSCVLLLVDNTLPYDAKLALPSIGSSVSLTGHWSMWIYQAKLSLQPTASATTVTPFSVSKINLDQTDAAHSITWVTTSSTAQPKIFQRLLYNQSSHFWCHPIATVQQFGGTSNTDGIYERSVSNELLWIF